MTTKIFDIGGADPASPQSPQQAISPTDGADEKSSLWDPEFERYVIQEVIFKSRGAVMEPRLYMSELAGSAQMRGEALFLAAGAKVGFNTYANSFFASYWEGFTNIRALSLSGKLSGEGLIYLFRSTAEGDAVKVGEYPVSGIFQIHFDLFSNLPSDDGAGRFFFDLEAVTDITVEKLAFAAFTPPKKTATFSLGLCTYGKEKYITNLAMSLEAYLRQGGTAISEVTIVNNEGTDDALPMLRRVADRVPAFTLLSQDNIGGAGGFARTLHVSQKSAVASHHVFMDDDVFLDTHMLDRLQAFVSYCNAPHIVGGQMMNMADPKMLYEGGATLDYWGFLQRVGKDIDGSIGAEVSFFDKVRKVDYNAWWFACVPKAEARELGLPLNIFIRGDDFEYGLRMARVGVATVSLPGLFLWHEPFESKSSAWLEYYNLRNRLIVTSIYDDSERFSILPTNMLRDIFVDFLQTERYEIAFAAARGALDFLRGPEAILTRHAEELHGEIRQALADMAEDDTAIAPRLVAEMADMGPQPALHPMLCLSHSSRLGGCRRDAKTIAWIDHPVVRVLEAVLARYGEEAEAVGAQWQARAHALASDAAWSELYGWNNT